MKKDDFRLWGIAALVLIAMVFFALRLAGVAERHDTKTFSAGKSEGWNQRGDFDKKRILKRIQGYYSIAEQRNDTRTRQIMAEFRAFVEEDKEAK